jgi:succinate-acetate transporter protein
VTEVKIANPGPLGLAGFALTTFVLSLINAGILSASHVGIVIGLAIAYGGIAQFAAGMWEFRSGNTFGATAFSSYGAFWLSFGVLLIGTGITKDNAPDDTTVGYYLLAWAIFTGLMMLASFRTNGATALVFVLLFITFLLLAVGKLNASNNIYGLGGWFGLATAVAAWYAALAGVFASQSKTGQGILPVFPFAQG